MAMWRTLEIGDIRVRIVEYSPGYLADHWCDRGHILTSAAVVPKSTAVRR